MRIMNNLAPTDAEITEQLLTDGGQWSPHELAEELGRHIDTVYRALDRLGDLVIHEYGDVRLRSKNIAQETLKYIRGAKESFDISLSEAADRMLQAEKVSNGDSAFSRWRETYGVDIESEEGDSDTLSMQYQPSNLQEVRKILRAGANKWSDLTDQTNKTFAFNHDLDITLATGKRLRVQHWSNWFGGMSKKLGDKTFG
jgi:hypothetical protein